MNESIYRPSTLLHFLGEIGIQAKKNLSQNFLIDGNIVRNILKASDVQKEDVVLEIGPGPGVLTEALLHRGCKVIAIEKDASLASALLRFQTKDKRLYVIQEDFLKFPLEEFLKKQLQMKKKIKVISNLPYQITTPILSRLVPLYDIISSITVMVQKEVAERFIAKKNTAQYSSFTLFLNYYCIPSLCFLVEPTCFYPKPKITSAVVNLLLKQPMTSHCIEGFFKIARKAFQKRRKMLRSSLREFYPPEKIEQSLVNIGLHPQARPENLSLEEFIHFFSLLS